MERAHHLDLNLLQGACFGLPPVAQGPRQARHLVGHLLHEPLRAVAGYGTIRHALLLSRMVGVSDESYPLGAERSTSCQFMTAPSIKIAVVSNPDMLYYGRRVDGYEMTPLQSLFS